MIILVLLFIVYIFAGCIVAGLAREDLKGVEYLTVFVILFWPLIIIAGFILVIIEKIKNR